MLQAVDTSRERLYHIPGLTEAFDKAAGGEGKWEKVLS
jgi:hypothetical protein